MLEETCCERNGLNCNQGRDCPARSRSFGIEGPYRRGPRSYRPLLAWVAVSAAAVVSALVWVLR